MSAINRFVHQLNTARKPVVETASAVIRFGEETAAAPTDTQAAIAVVLRLVGIAGIGTPVQAKQATTLRDKILALVNAYELPTQYKAAYTALKNSVDYGTGVEFDAYVGDKFSTEADSSALRAYIQRMQNAPLKALLVQGVDFADRFDNDGETASSTLDKLSAQNGARRIGAADRARYTRDVIKNMTVEQITAKLAELKGKTDDASKSWVAIYTEALRQKNGG